MRCQSIVGAGLIVFLLGACGDDGGGVICGNGTEESGGECVAISPDAGGVDSPADRRLCDQPFGPIGPGALLVDLTYSGTDSNGSAERPFTDVQTAINAASAGQEIGIAAGTYAGNLTIGASLSLEGRCANDVIIEGGIHVQDTGGVAIRGLTVREGSPGILADNVQPEADDAFGLRMRFVRATQNNGAGIEMNGSAVEILDSEFTLNRQVNGGDIRQLGSGLFVNDGSLFDLRTSYIEMNGFMGVDVADASGQQAAIVGGSISKATATSPSNGYIEMNGIISNEGGGIRVGGAPSGLLAPTDSALVEILSNDFSGNVGYAIQIASARANIVGNNLVGGSGSKAGIYVEFSTGTIGGNEIEEFVEGGMDLSESQGLAIANNTLSNNSDVGIRSFNNRGISLSGNQVKGTRDGASAMATGHGIYIATDGAIANVGSHDLTGNTVSDNEGVGIAVHDLDLGNAEERVVTMFGNTVARNALMGIDLRGTRAVGMFGNALIDNVGHGLRCVDGPGSASRVFFDDNLVRGTLATPGGLDDDGDAVFMSNCHISVDLNTIKQNARNGVLLDNQTDGGCDDNDATGHAANGPNVHDITTRGANMGAMNNPLADTGDEQTQDVAVNTNPIAPPGL